MRNLIHLFCAVFLACPLLHAGSGLKAKTAAPADSLTLVVGSQIKNRQQAEQLYASLASTPGVKVVAYCSNLEVYIIRSSGNTYANGSEMFTALQKQAPGLELWRKTGSVKQIISECRFEGSTDVEQIKELQK